ncbi:phage head closure protein [Xenorhabdus bovienii]|uniref:phage head closure protein n=1 Tax=Xenorhabdus bovienii TaxID=40576 RepID=UPI0023B23CF9|nr:phage head closure protein [Xenorhabdus bovienii]MDE9492686.1 phage head closure protein [Xenorhabdus bovienii]MDE9501213.1 phage head closure protein [Xenorhabdus bovienii]MDE9526392.1 phage head closure protein [Xenorhabdus bovienii]MDE9569820.1 phage head closure protein [Xenorhabdus bovienii]
MKAGLLRYRIKLFRPIKNRDDLGAEIIGREYVTETWARAEVMSNRKIRTADQQHVIEVQQFTVRPRKDVEPNWLVEHQGRLFTVRTVDRNRADRAVITTEADVRHDRT